MCGRGHAEKSPASGHGPGAPRVRNERIRDRGHATPTVTDVAPSRADPTQGPPAPADSAGAFMASGIAAHPPAASRRDRTLALSRRDRRGPRRHRRRLPLPRVRQGAQVAGHRIRRPHQDAHRAVIFCTIVLGIGSIRSASKVGRVGGLALGYFLVMSTVALAIGLIVGNLLDPGDGLQLSDAVRGQGAELATTAEGSGGTTDFLLGSSRPRCCRPSPRARCSRPCWSPCSWASPSRPWGAR